MNQLQACARAGCGAVSTQRYCSRHRPVADFVVRRVWYALSQSPRAGYAELAARCGCGRSTVHRALLRLEALGVIETQPHLHGTRRLSEPFCWFED